MLLPNIRYLVKYTIILKHFVSSCRPSITWNDFPKVYPHTGKNDDCTIYIQQLFYISCLSFSILKRSKRLEIRFAPVNLHVERFHNTNYDEKGVTNMEKTFIKVKWSKCFYDVYISNIDSKSRLIRLFCWKRKQVYQIPIVYIMKMKFISLTPKNSHLVVAGYTFDIHYVQNILKSWKKEMFNWICFMKIRNGTSRTNVYIVFVYIHTSWATSRPSGELAIPRSL